MSSWYSINVNLVTFWCPAEEHAVLESDVPGGSGGVESCTWAGLPLEGSICSSALQPVCLPLRLRRVRSTGITWPSQELQDQSAGSSNLTGNVCFKSIQEKHFCLFLALHLRGSVLSFTFLFCTTALHWKPRPSKDLF